MTNLHIGNLRGDVDDLRDAMGRDRWRQLTKLCENIARVFPKTTTLGVVVLPTPGFRKMAVLEVNAFGDLLPDDLWKGRDTYTAQIGARSLGR